MNKIESYSKVLTWFMALLLSALVAGCGGGGGGGQAPILGTPGIGPLAPPTVIAVVPLAGANNVAINITIITAQFSEPMNPATLTPATFTVACTTACAKPPTVLTVGLDVTNRIATLTLANSPLVALTTYTATVTTGAKSLATGLGLASPFVWNFTTVATPDATRPSVTFTVPANLTPGVPGVAINTAITAVFSEEMAPATLVTPATTPASSFTVTGPGGANVVGAVTYVVGSRTAVFKPAVNLTPSTLYTATVTTAATDLAGNLLFSPVAVPVLPQVANPWTFTTAAAPALDVTAPILNATVPVNNALAVPIDQTLSATFNETMNTASVVAAFTLRGPAPGVALIAGTANYDPLTSIATFNPTVDLAPGVYTATIAATATDAAGNALVVPPVGGLPVPNPWTFTVAGPAIGVVVDLGAATPFGAFGGTAGMTNSGNITVINGDFGTTQTATASITGFHDSSDSYIETCPGSPVLAAGCGTVNGTLFTCAASSVGVNAGGANAVNCGIATVALGAAQTAFNTLVAFPGAVGADNAARNLVACGGCAADDLGLRTLAAGVYSAVLGAGAIPSYRIAGGDLTLDAQNDPNAFWIFKMPASTLTVGLAGVARSVILKNGAKASRVFWQVGSSATINGIIGGGTMVGTIIAAQAISISTTGQATPVTLNGRALSLIAGVTMTNSVISVPAP